MPTMRAVQAALPGGPLDLLECPIPEPGPGRIRVQACGTCHSDSLTKESHWRGIGYPHVPGRELVGVMDVVGPGVPPRWIAGERVGAGWHAWHCGYCDDCRRGDFIAGQTGPKATGISFDGGYGYSGTSIDSHETLGFSRQAGVRSINEVYSLERAAEAYERMMSGKARFRVVLTMGSRRGNQSGTPFARC